MSTFVTHNIYNPSHKTYTGKSFGPYTCLEKIGSGGFCHVYKCTDHHNTFAIKIYHKHYTYSFNQEASTLIYLKNLSTITPHLATHILLPHDFITSIYSTETLHPTIYPLPAIIFPLMHETLYDVMKKLNSGFTLPCTKTIIKQILHGLTFIHSCGIVHTDIKSNNIILTTPADTTHNKNINIKIMDFGCATKPISTDTVGTTGYQSPESLLHTGFSFPTDIWSFGCLVYELITGNVLFDKSYLIKNDNTHDNTNDTSESSESSETTESSETAENNESIITLKLFEKVLGFIPIDMIYNSNIQYYHDTNDLDLYPTTISQLLQQNHSINITKSKQIEQFITFILQYPPSQRPSITEILEHKFLSPTIKKYTVKKYNKIKKYKK